MGGFIAAKRTIFMALESTPFTFETMVAADGGQAADAITYDPEIQMFARKVATGDYGKAKSIAGKRSITIGFNIPFYSMTDLAAPPKFSIPLQACGLAETIYGAVGVGWLPNCFFSTTPMSIEIIERFEGASPSQVVIPAHGCMGNVKFVVGNIGEPMMMQFEFKGVLGVIADRAFGSILIPTGFDDEDPDAVLNAGLTLFAEGQNFNTKTLDLGNVVELWTSSDADEGFEGARVVDRTPTLEVDPDLQLIATQGDFARWIGDTEGAYSMDVGSTNFSAPAAQLTKAYSPSVREGHVVNQKTLQFNRGPAGNDEFAILQGAVA